MPESMEFLRGVLGVIGLGCAYMAGRSLVSVRKGWQKISKLYGWVIRTLVCLIGMAFRHSIDNIDMAIWALAVLAFGLGVWNTAHQKPPEDLSREIFPE
ncbi:MAG TPA: hypothetical protein VKU19_37695 [Bryobacteraceae bacterium]|nr:hypothetical protein [Bryobacteraceae bacterium]